MKLKATLLFIWGMSSFLTAQIVSIPDANFKAALVANPTINTNSDTEIQISEANAYTDTLDVSNNSIEDLRGIEAFTAITAFFCDRNLITSLDLSANKALTTISCTYNDLFVLDFSGNPVLTTLVCKSNGLKSLDVSQNPALTSLTTIYNVLPVLDVSRNPALTELRCSYNQLFSLNVANGANVKIVDKSLAQNLILTLLVFRWMM